jgi:ABC-type multidrug transport system ATPase subunit
MHCSIRSLSKSYGKTPVLRDISLEIAPGQIVALVGANGAGKTTLLRSLAGIAGLDAGEIRYDGELFCRDRIDLRRRFAFLPDVPYYYGEMSILRHIGMVLAVYETDTTGIEDRIVELLRDLDLLPLAECSLASLSRGQLYKAALAAVLAVDPEFRLLDEPFASGMDPRGLTFLRDEARSAAACGRTVLYTTQILEVAERFADRICILNNGRIEAFGTMNEILGRAGAERSLADVFAQLHEAAP